MGRLSVICGALALVLVGLMAACGGDPVSRNPFSPQAPGVGGLQLSGPASIPPGQSGQFIAETRLSDGTVKSSTSALTVRWRSSNTSILQVSQSGVATAGATGGEATVIAELLPNTAIRGIREVVVVPDGTYRVVGSVREAENPAQPIPGARVEVSGSTLATTTDALGNYRLYGVPAAAEIRVTASGYLPVAHAVQLAAHGAQNFQLPLDGPRVNLNGRFTLTIEANGACSGSPALPTDLRRRTYEALVTTTGSVVDVLLTELRFRVVNGRGDRFRGRADPAQVRFTLDPFTPSFYYYYYYSYPSIAERLSDNTHLAIHGAATTSRVNGGVTGTLSGGILRYDSRFPSFATFLGGCSSSGLRLTLTPR